jgi:geranylgeranyl diphosphate synthase type I
MAQESMSAADIKAFESKFGKSDLDAEGIAILRQIISDSGALEHVENLITNLTNTASQALDTKSITPQARQVLSELAIIATKRNL